MKRIALVTGGSGGIGSAIVAALERDGLSVVNLDRDGDLSCDLASEAETRDAARRFLDARGRCDVLVHAAAAVEPASLESVDVDLWRRVQSVNVEAAVWLCQELVPAMREQAYGRVVFIVSDTIWRPPDPTLLPYIVSKAALVGLTRSLAASLGGDGITVNAVAPGLTDTQAARDTVPGELFAVVREQQATPRTLLPFDSADMVAFAASDRAAALTGQCISVDGGLVMR